jgi:hypothetical protein
MRDIIAKNQIGNGLDKFRRLSRAECEDLSISEVRKLAETSDIGKSKQPLANSKLICVGAVSSRTGRGTLLRDLSNLVS